MFINVKSKTILSDLYTPVSLYLKLRDSYSIVHLLESSEYASKEGSYSFLAFDELSSIEIKDNSVLKQTINLPSTQYALSSDVVSTMEEYIHSFDIIYENEQDKQFNSLLGFTTFEANKYFEQGIYSSKPSEYNIPDIKYSLFRFIIIFDHFKHTLQIVENIPQQEESKLEDVLHQIDKQDIVHYDFKCDGVETANLSDEEYAHIVGICKQHCQRGDVFQIVPSRRYSYNFKGDEFNVYRRLRSINPSPYLFYFDYGAYRIFGSSPEAQIIIREGVAEVHPIAGTIRRTQDVLKDKANTEQLINDPKENAEHIMLVDLARNDLSRNTELVHVASYRDVQYFSHVIHLVSKVKGTLKNGVSAFQVFADTFPQGTLSGAPKIKALEIIENVEPTHRGHYGGAIGMLGFDNTMNQAIIIRSILSINNTLYLQAGGGVVIDSQEEFELKEVKNKLGALKLALTASI
jgi:anthranilate synthase component I